MTEAAAAADAPVDDLVEGDAPADEAEAQPDNTERATGLGWTPKDKFKGDPTKWVDADEFVRRGEELMPILKAHARKLERKVAEQEQTLKRFSEWADKSEKRAYERALADIRSEHAQAVENGDIAGADKALDKLTDLKAEAMAPKPAAAQSDAVLDDWVEENPWFNTDRVMKAAAIEIAEEIKADFPDPARQLAEVAKRIKVEFPHKFKPAVNPRREAASAVEGAPNAGRRGVGNTYSDLPPEAKRDCDDFVKRIPGFTREKYVKEFDFKGYVR